MRKAGKSQIGHYTYLLIDPADNSVFYVGKGSGDRINDHSREVSRGCLKDNPRKFARIAEIHKGGQQVIARIFSRHSSSDEAYQSESLLIAALSGTGLTNILQGQRITSQERAQLCLGRLKDFELWVSGATRDVLEFCTESKGSPRAFFDWFVQSLTHEAGCV